MSNRQRGYGEILPDWVPPDVEYVTEAKAHRNARRAFLYGAVLFAVIGFGAGMAFGQGFYRCEQPDRITLEPQDPMMMAFPSEGDLLDGEERRFIIQGGLS